jgi:ParB family protein of integrating conjugative element (PFGI_1 class)
MTLRVDQIHEYEHNPRRSSNAKFEEIKYSIRTTGLRNPLTVTRRPGETHFIVEAGGNTRLLALQQLWAETGEPRFEALTVLFRPWRSESHVLSAHLIENEQRGDLTYWDKANGIMALRTQLEKEQERALSLGELEKELRGLGYVVSKAALGFYAFAVQRLGTLGEALPWLTSDGVKRLQQRVNRIRRYAEGSHGVTEAELYSEVIEPSLAEAAAQCASLRAIDPDFICDRIAGTFAQYLCRPAAEIRQAVEADDSPASVSASLPSTSAVIDAEDNSSVALRDSQDPIRELVRRFARLTGIDPWLDWTPDDQSGFRVRSFQQASTSREGDPYEAPTRRAGRVLRCIAGQAQEPGETDPSPEERAEQALLAWLLDRDDQAAAVFIDLLWALRRGASDHRRSTIPLRTGLETVRR